MSGIALDKPDGTTILADGDNFVQQSVVALDGSNRTFTVPAEKTWKFDFLWARLVSNATVGNRQMRIDIGDGTNVLWFKNFGAVQAASLTRDYYAAADMPDDAAFNAAGQIRMWLLARTLPAGYTIRVYDVSAIDNVSPADTLTVRFLVDERRVGARV